MDWMRKKRHNKLPTKYQLWLTLSGRRKGHLIFFSLIRLSYKT